MSKLNAALSPQLSKFIKESFPVVKKRSALWFFSEGLKNNLTPPVSLNGYNKLSNHAKETNGLTGEDNDAVVWDPSSSNRAASSKMSRNKVLQLWRNMDPESKRWYFKMAELDEVRYKEQKSIWVSEVISLFREHGSVERVFKLAPTRQDLQAKFEDSVDEMHRSYEQMIETESTRMIYKDAIKKAHEPSLETDELILAVPRQQRAILTKPRRPPAAFVLFLSDNMDRYKEMRRKSRLKASCLKLASKEWAELDQEAKMVYEKRYRKLKLEYNKAMDLYKSEFMDSKDSYLQTALREKKAFRRSLRKRLRDSSILPICIRNSFNFFVMDNKDAKLKDLTTIWRDLKPQEKEKYLKMSEEDKIRYQREIEAYNKMRKTFSEMDFKRQGKSDPEPDIK